MFCVAEEAKPEEEAAEPAVEYNAEAGFQAALPGEPAGPAKLLHL